VYVLREAAAFAVFSVSLGLRRFTIFVFAGSVHLIRHLSRSDWDGDIIPQ